MFEIFLNYLQEEESKAKAAEDRAQARIVISCLAEAAGTSVSGMPDRDGDVRCSTSKWQRRRRRWSEYGGSWNSWKNGQLQMASELLGWKLA